jgi:DNA polymerase-3 subunit epsilon
MRGSATALSRSAASNCSAGRSPTSTSTGLTRDFLSDKPLFREVAKEFLDFVVGAELLIHNASFDVEFLDRELAAAGLGKLAKHVAGITDTLAMARELHPGKRNALDTLCERYAINNSHRTLHGALLDARLLAEVYLAMTRGQESLVIDLESAEDAAASTARIDPSKLIVVRATPEELEAHQKVLIRLDKQAKGGAVWNRKPAET